MKSYVSRKYEITPDQFKAVFTLHADPTDYPFTQVCEVLSIPAGYQEIPAGEKARVLQFQFYGNRAVCCLLFYIKNLEWLVAVRPEDERGYDDLMVFLVEVELAAMDMVDTFLAELEKQLLN